MSDVTAVVTPEAPPVEPPVKLRRKLHASRFASAETTRRLWAVTLEQGTPFDAMFEPEFWAHVARQVRPADKIEVVDDGFTFYAELIVRSANQLSVSVELLVHKELGGDAVSMDAPSPYVVEFAGRYHKWRVMRKTDGSVVKPGFATREEAEFFLRNYAKGMAA